MDPNTDGDDVGIVELDVSLFHIHFPIFCYVQVDIAVVLLRLCYISIF